MSTVTLEAGKRIAPEKRLVFLARVALFGSLIALAAAVTVWLQGPIDNFKLVSFLSICFFALIGGLWTRHPNEVALMAAIGGAFTAPNTACILVFVLSAFLNVIGALLSLRLQQLRDLKLI